MLCSGHRVLEFIFNVCLSFLGRLVSFGEIRRIIRRSKLNYQTGFHSVIIGPYSYSVSLREISMSGVLCCVQGIEFWSSVCDEEMDLLIEAQEATEQGRAPESVSRHYAKGALAFIVPILLETLTKQVASYSNAFS